VGGEISIDKVDASLESPLKQAFEGLHQFLVKWHYRPKGRKRSFYGQKLI
jgi:hypothetical protein